MAELRVAVLPVFHLLLEVGDLVEARVVFLHRLHVRDALIEARRVFLFGAERRFGGSELGFKLRLLAFELVAGARQLGDFGVLRVDVGVQSVDRGVARGDRRLLAGDGRVVGAFLLAALFDFLAGGRDDFHRRLQIDGLGEILVVEGLFGGLGDLDEGLGLFDRVLHLAADEEEQRDGGGRKNNRECAENNRNFVVHGVLLIVIES